MEGKRTYVVFTWCLTPLSSMSYMPALAWGTFLMTCSGWPMSRRRLRLSDNASDMSRTLLKASMPCTAVRKTSARPDYVEYRRRNSGLSSASTAPDGSLTDSARPFRSPAARALTATLAPYGEVAAPRGELVWVLSETLLNPAEDPTEILGPPEEGRFDGSVYRWGVSETSLSYTSISVDNDYE